MARDTEPVKRKQFKAVCPRVSTHSARVVDVARKEITLGESIKGVGKKGDRVTVGVRRSVCDDCGHEWREQADLPDETTPEMPKYPDVRCKNQNHHTLVECYKRLNGQLYLVCHQCAQDNTWQVKDEISDPKPTTDRKSNRPPVHTPPHKRGEQQRKGSPPPSKPGPDSSQAAASGGNQVKS